MPVITTGSRPEQRITIQHTRVPRPKPADAALGFGKVFTDHMFLQNYEPEHGWANGRIEPYHQLSLDPAAAVVHYAQAVFDGLKAFRSVDDQVRLFRPRKHA